MINEKGFLEEAIDDVYNKHTCLTRQGFQIFGAAWSNRFGVYDIEIGCGKPIKVEIASINRGLAIGLAESIDGSGGVEVFFLVSKENGQTSRGNIDILTRLAPREVSILYRQTLKILLKKRVK